LTLITHLARQLRKPFIFKQLQREWKILDLGCGDGWLTDCLNKNHFDAIGVDINSSYTLSNFIKADASKLSFKDNSFDCIIMVEVVEHLNTSKVYSEIRRILKPEGKLIVTTPHPKFEWFIELLKKLRLVKYHDFPHTNPTYLEDLPFRLITKSRMFLIDQMGIYVNKK